MIELLGISIIFVAGAMLGYITGRKDKSRDGIVVNTDKTMLNYSALTPNSKRYVSGIIEGRIVHDERTTYKER